LEAVSGSQNVIKTKKRKRKKTKHQHKHKRKHKHKSETETETETEIKKEPKKKTHRKKKIKTNRTNESEETLQETKVIIPNGEIFIDDAGRERYDIVIVNNKEYLSFSLFFSSLSHTKFL
jgi:hypothetical protein